MQLERDVDLYQYVWYDDSENFQTYKNYDMQRIPKHFKVTHPGKAPVCYLDEEVAKTEHDAGAEVEIIEESFIFNSIPERLLFEENNKYFFEEAKQLNLSGCLSKRGSELLQQRIKEKSKEKVAFLLHRPIVMTPMGTRLRNRLLMLKLYDLLSIVKIRDTKELLKRRRLGPVLTPELLKVLKREGLELGMFLPELPE